jgi:hypothetical protein
LLESHLEWQLPRTGTYALLGGLGSFVAWTDDELIRFWGFCMSSSG